MFYQALVLRLVLIFSLGFPVYAENIVVSGLIDYQTRENSSEIIAELASKNGKVIWLDLALIQSSKQSSFGFSLEPVLLDTIDRIDNNGFPNPFSCGVDNHIGLVRNFKSQYLLSFGNTQDYHSQTEIYMADRLSVNLVKNPELALDT